MSLHLYNSLTKREEEFKPLNPPKVSMYTCGPTVYGRPHIGNYSSFLMADLLRRWLQHGHGYEVIHVKNITDVGHLLHDADCGDDKVEREARRAKIHPLEVARRYEEQYLEDERVLELLEPACRPRASETIPEMLSMIRVLCTKGHAYETPDGIYFAVETFPLYGRLSGNTLENIKVGARVEVDEGKKHPADFALWKKCTGENAHHILRWSFATGAMAQGEGEDLSAGFPGWHIECSAMSRKFLGDTIDIHTGGEDNIFPHHECEIAQSEGVTGKPFVRTFIHRRRIDIGRAKMSKSLGNVLGLSDIIERGFHPLDLRYYLLSVHYRTNLKFSWEGMNETRKARKRVLEWMQWVGEGCASQRSWREGESRGALEVNSWHQKFEEAMDSDLNTPAALGVLFDTMVWSRLFKMNEDAVIALRELVSCVQGTFGCFEEEEIEIPQEVQHLLVEREERRKEGKFAAADMLRLRIQEQGFTVRDTPQGPRLQKS